MSKNDLKSTKKAQNIKTLSFHCIILSLICQALALCLSSTPVSANTNDFYFEYFSADYYLSRDANGASRLKVVETFTAVFPNYNQNHGITRVIPYTNQDGENLTMASDSHLDLKIYHNDQLEQPHDIENGDGYFTVYIGDANKYVHGQHTYRLEYEFVNVITTFTSAGVLTNQPSDQSGWQELYWDTNGNDWSQKFDRLSARVHLTRDLLPSLTSDVSCYVGYYGDIGQGRCEILEQSDGYQFSTTDLKRGENLTFNLQFKPNTFAAIPKKNDYTFAVIFAAEIILAALCLGQAYRHRSETKEKREFYKHYFIKPEYTPPANLSIAAAAENYIGKYALGSSKVATLINLAVTGKVQLIKTEKTGFLGLQKTVWKIRIVSTDLSETEEIVLKLLKGKNSTLNVNEEIAVKTHSSNSSLINLGEKYDKKAKTELQALGFYEPDPKDLKNLHIPDDPKSLKKHHSASSLLLMSFGWLFIGFVVGIFVTDAASPYRHLVLGNFIPLYWLIAILMFGVLISQYGQLEKYYTHTLEGLKTSRYLDGLKLYIQMAEAERLKFLHSVPGADVSNDGIVKLYEKLLPYAILFRLEKTWLAELSKYYELQDVATPAWYVGVGAFSASDFTKAMSSVSTSVSHSVSSGSSSSSSGSSGGGFSGGGGGGGGGGGW